MDVLQKTEIFNFLERNQLATLSTVSPEGTPYGSAVYVVTEPDFTMRFITKTKTAKLKHLLQCVDVSVTFVEEKTFQTVQSLGRACPVSDIKKAVGIIEALSTRIANHPSHPEWLPPVRQYDAGDYTVIEIHPYWLRFADFGNDKKGKGEIFFEVISK